jgi:hypothetical protein
LQLPCRPMASRALWQLAALEDIPLERVIPLEGVPSHGTLAAVDSDRDIKASSLWRSRAAVVVVLRRPG